MELHSLNLFLHAISTIIYFARWPTGQCAQRAIAEAKQTFVKVSHWMGDQNLLSRAPRASEGKLSGWSRLHLQSLAHTPVSRRVDVKQAVGWATSSSELLWADDEDRRPIVKIIAESLSQHEEKHVVPTPT
jgi:hypothetical protein